MNALLWMSLACTGSNPDPEPKDSDTGTTDTSPPDADEDGYDASVDCDDQDPAVHPDAQEVCDDADLDEDCDGKADDDDDSTTGQTDWYADVDADGYGNPDDVTQRCGAADRVDNGEDCDDLDEAINPGATEICDEADVDEDCDGDADDDDDAAEGRTVVYVDLDGDGYGDDARQSEVCDPVSGQVLTGGDCNDGDYRANPGAGEVCDEDDVDEDCDGQADDDDDSATGQTTAWTDADGDGYGDPATELSLCNTDGLVLVGEDCDDADPAVSPATPWYADADADGYGDPAGELQSCLQPEGYVADLSDCDDARADVHPGGVEVCDDSDVDEDCNGLADDSDTGVDPGSLSTWHRDADKDSYGSDLDTTQSCERPTGYIEESGDCDDDNVIANPGRTEICNDGFDDDCNGDADECDLGGETRLNLASTEAILSGSSEWGGLGLFVYGPGDLTGDGQDDLFVGGRDWSAVEAYGGAAWVFAGPVIADGDDTSAAISFYGTDAFDAMGTSARAADFDEDGTVDLAISAPSCLDGGGDAGWIGLWWGPFDAAEDRSTADQSWTGDLNDDFQGYAMASGDLDGDGHLDLAWTGAEYDAVFVLSGPFLRDAPGTPLSWATGAGIGDTTGSLSAGDLDGDGVDELVTASFWGDGGGTGTVWISDGMVTDLDSDATARLSGDADSDYFGHAVDVGADGDGDGYHDLLVGAPGVDSPFEDAGAVLLFAGPISSDLGPADATATLSGISINQYLGHSLAWAGDIDRDGVPDVVAGVPYQDGTATDGGAAYLWFGPLSGALTLGDADLSLEGTGENDQAGDAVAGGGDLTGDGTDDLVIGAWWDDDGAEDGGSVYVVGGSGL